jgi:hypothetical protein
LVLFINTAPGQSANGTVSGIVLDPSGAVIAGADVLIVNDATAVQYPGKTNSEGYYVVPNIPPGTYRIQVSNTGFKTIIKPDIVIHVEDALAINFTLPIGAASEVVTVEGGAPLVNTENASVGTVIDRKFIESLPLNGRSFNTLLQLTPGVVIAPTSSNSPGQFSIAGQRTDANSFTVDGVSANFGVGSGLLFGGSGSGTAQALSALGGTSSLVSVDDLQEFRIETSSFAPEFGRQPGGQVILTTRSGTNDFHGGIFDYFRNTAMDANDWFSDSGGLPRAPEHHNDFGGFFGGPIQRNKTFIFVSYEGARLDLPKTQVSSVPSEWARTVAAPPGLMPYLNAFPEPADKTVTPNVYTSPLTSSFSNRATLDAGSIRIDHSFGIRFSIFGRYNDAPSETLARVFALSDLETTAVNTQTLTVGVNMIFNQRVSNTLRGNYSKQSSGTADALDSYGGAEPLSPALLLGGLAASTTYVQFATFDTNFYFTGSDAGNRTRQLNLVDDVSWSQGLHALKFGADYRAVFLDKRPFQNELLYTADTVQDFISGGQATLFTATAARAQLLAQAVSLYAQDTWKVSPRLTLTYGLRWELSPAPSARGTTHLAAWTNTGNPAEVALAPAGTPLWATTYGNFAPRAGIAFSLTPKGDFVMRAGGGVYYDLGIGQVAQLATSFPNFASGTAGAVSLPLGDATPFLPALSLQPPYGGVQAFVSNLQLPRSYQWNIALEKSFGGHQVISATYVGQAGRDLLRQEALFQPNANFTGDFLLRKNDARSNYNALQVQFRKPLSTRVQALLNYSWSHSLDNASDDVVVGLSNTVISAARDYGNSAFDVRQSFSGALTYTIPGMSWNKALSALTSDWSVNSVIVARTGFPFSTTIVGTSPDPGGQAYTRPDIVPGQPLWVPDSTAPGGKSLNINAFSIPSTIRQGTEGRNDIPGFGFTQVDLSLGRQFPVRERLNLQFRCDAFNVLNHPNFTNPLGFIQFGPTYLMSQSMLNVGLGGLNPLFQEGGPRSLQLSLKLAF